MITAKEPEKHKKLHDPKEKSRAWSFSFETSGLVDRFLAVLFPRYRNIANGNQCVAVKPENNGFQLRYLQARYHNVNHCCFELGIAALSLQQRDASSQPVGQRGGNV